MMTGQRQAGSAVFLLREKPLSATGDYWIEDEGGQQIYKVDGKLMRMGKTAILEDPAGREVLTVKHRLVHIHRTIELTRAGQLIATVQEPMVSLRHKYTIELASGGELHATGSLSAREFELDQDGQQLARLLHKFIQVRDTVAVKVLDPQNTELVLGIVVAIDMAEEFHRGSG
jgi:uncharacterized protein YxjI